MPLTDKQEGIVFMNMGETENIDEKPEMHVDASDDPTTTTTNEGSVEDSDKATKL